MGDSLQAEGLENRLQQAAEFKNNGQYDEALAEFRSILAQAPDCVQARLGLGLVLCFMGDFDASLIELQQAVIYGPACVDTHLNLAKTYAMLGMYEEARKEFQEVLCLCPDHKEAVKQMALFEESQ